MFEYLDSCQITCDFTDVFTFEPQRQHGKSIMNFFTPSDVQAYHLECEAGQEDEYAKVVAWLYSSTRNDPPCNEQMRFIGLSQHYQNTNFQRIQSQLRTKQL